MPSVLEKISTPALHCVLLRVVFSLKNLAFAHPYLCEAPETKTTDATGRRIKKCRINERQISSETQLPQALGSALNIKNSNKNRKVNQYSPSLAHNSSPAAHKRYKYRLWGGRCGCRFACGTHRRRAPHLLGNSALGNDVALCCTSTRGKRCCNVHLSYLRCLLPTYSFSAIQKSLC
ncbi:hypothetical protein HMPREF0971_02378 [Segatella oris F0302]|uniref:Uncharacterized protein n=1 Tax=Segatella oris F0302 TaxID=649760 RepID=D1QTP9_9BACT|nr:hypothetical protein HMPREF0971_02378 [Segatella oris F0302]